MVLYYFSIFLVCKVSRSLLSILLLLPLLLLFCEGFLLVSHCFWRYSQKKFLNFFSMLLFEVVVPNMKSLYIGKLDVQ